jgi:hypothetical protein
VSPDGPEQREADRLERDTYDHDAQADRADERNDFVLDATSRGLTTSAVKQAREAGKTAKAERCYAKSQYWLDRYNRLIGAA